MQRSVTSIGCTATQEIVGSNDGAEPAIDKNPLGYKVERGLHALKILASPGPEAYIDKVLQRFAGKLNSVDATFV